MVRPMSETAAFIQLDDLTEAKLDRGRSVAFLTVQTSPGNNQAWIAAPSFAHDQDRKDFTRRVKKQVTADSSATGSVRLAGTSNFKADSFPGSEMPKNLLRSRADRAIPFCRLTIQFARLWRILVMNFANATLAEFKAEHNVYEFVQQISSRFSPSTSEEDPRVRPRKCNSKMRSGIGSGRGR
jgi:hypothetical protein